MSGPGPDANADVETLEVFPGRPEQDAAVEASDAQPWDSCAHPVSDAGLTSAGLPEFLDLNITGVGFQLYEGQRIHVVTFDQRNNNPLGDGIATIKTGTFYLHFPNGYYEFSYQRIFFHVDVNGDGRCDVAGGDHVGSVLTSAHRTTAYDYSLVELDPPGGPSPAAAVICEVVTSCQSAKTAAAEARGPGE